MYFLIKVHKKNFPGRAVVNQIDDPTYKICKILTDILNPLAINGQSFVENSYDSKKTLAMIQVDKDEIQASFDVVALYPSIPIDKALDCIRERDCRKMILYQKEQSGNQMISSIYSKFA